MKKTITKAILMCAFTCIVLLIIISFNDIKSIFKTLTKVNFGYLAISFLVIALYAGLSPIPLWILTKTGGVKIPFNKLYRISQTEFFFNGITPFASGGQPFQVYAFKRANVDANKSTGILLMNFVIYQTSIMLLCIFAMGYYKYLSHLTNIRVLIIVGFIINFVILGLFVSLGFSKKIRKALIWLVSKIAKIKWWRKWMEPKIALFEEYCVNAQKVFQEIIHNKLTFIGCLLIKLVLQIIYFSIPFFILRSLGVELKIDQMLLIIAMTSFAVTMTCFIPTPGASGGIELAFKSIFATIVVGITNAVVVSGMLLWRLFTYYLLIIFGFVNYVSLEASLKHDEEKRMLEKEIEEVLNEAQSLE